MEDPRVNLSFARRVWAADAARASLAATRPAGYFREKGRRGSTVRRISGEFWAVGSTWGTWAQVRRRPSHWAIFGWREMTTRRLRLARKWTWWRGAWDSVSWRFSGERMTLVLCATAAISRRARPRRVGSSHEDWKAGTSGPQAERGGGSATAGISSFGKSTPPGRTSVPAGNVPQSVMVRHSWSVVRGILSWRAMPAAVSGRNGMR